MRLPEVISHASGIAGSEAGLIILDFSLKDATVKLWVILTESEMTEPAMIWPIEGRDCRFQYSDLADIQVDGDDVYFALREPTGLVRANIRTATEAILETPVSPRAFSVMNGVVAVSSVESPGALWVRMKNGAWREVDRSLLPGGQNCSRVRLIPRFIRHDAILVVSTTDPCEISLVELGDMDIDASSSRMPRLATRFFDEQFAGVLRPETALSGSPMVVWDVATHPSGGVAVVLLARKWMTDPQGLIIVSEDLTTGRTSLPPPAGEMDGASWHRCTSLSDAIVFLDIESQQLALHERTRIVP